MSLAIKVLEKSESTLEKTATAWLGGLIASETTGYTADDCTISHNSTYHRWVCTGNSAGTELELRYDTSVSCAEGDIIYMYARMRTTSADMDVMYLRCVGTTGGTTTIVDSQADPVQNTWYTLSGTLAASADWSGYYRLRWTLADAGGINTKVLNVQKWVAINLTVQFGAGSEPDAADLDAFFEWRWEYMDHENYGLYTPTYGDKYYFASKIASHGLEYNDMILSVYNDGADDHNYLSPVYVLNDDWIITQAAMFLNTPHTHYDDNWPTIYYWTKTDYTSRLKEKTLQINMRGDVDGSASLTFMGDSTWQPQLGMTVMLLDDTEWLFTGHISKIKTSNMEEGVKTNWRCDCDIASLLETLKWVPSYIGEDWFATMGAVTTKQYLEVLIHANLAGYPALDGLAGGQGLWIGTIDEGGATVTPFNPGYKTVYESINSLCMASGLSLLVTGDRRLKIMTPDTTPTDAPRNITDAVGPRVWGMLYSEDITDYATSIILRGGYDTSGSELLSFDTVAIASRALSNDIYGGESCKTIIISDTTVTDQTDADAAAVRYKNRHSLVIPGTFEFTTTDTDYRPGMKISVDIDSLGMTATRSMLIDEVTLYDPDGLRLFSRVKCSRRDGTTFANSPMRGSGGYMTTVANKIDSSVSALKQAAGTFTPALEGSTTAGTWAWTTQSGYYVRHGNMVYVNIYLVASSITDSPAGDLMLTGLPFTSSDLTYQYLEVFSGGLAWGTNATVAKVAIATESTEGTFYGAQNNAATTVIAVGNVTAGDGIRVIGWYQIKP